MKAKTNQSNIAIKSFLRRSKHILKLAVVPHKNNDYRPHLIRRYGLIAIVFVVIGLQFGYNLSKTGSVLGVETDVTINLLFDQTNLYRQQNGEAELTLNEKLNKAAYLKANDMFANQYWSHISPDGTQPWKWFTDVDYNYSQAGENLAKNFTSTSAVMTAWLDSPEHKANIIKSSYTDVGFAIISGELNEKPTTLVVALYGTPAESAVAGTKTVFSGASLTSQINILTQFAVATQSVTPAVIGGLLLIMITMAVSAVAHTYRRKLPKSLRQSWYRHHGLIKSIGLLSLGIVVILLYGGGQI